MYKGFYFNVSKNAFRKRKTGNKSSIWFYSYYDKGVELFENYKQKAIDDFLLYMKTEEYIDLNQRKINCFSDINCQLFIPNLHKDKELAIALSGYLYEKYNLICLIDSSLGGNTDELFNIISDKWSENMENPDYNKSDLTKNVVDMILEMEIKKMINKNKCLIFLNNIRLTSSTTLKICRLNQWLFCDLGFKRIRNPKNTVMIKCLYGLKKPKNFGIIGKILKELDLNSLRKLERKYVFSDTISEKGEEYLEFLYRELKPFQLEKNDFSIIRSDNNQ